MLHRLTAAAGRRWHALTHKAQSDRGDSPIPTVIIWMGVAVIAVGLVTWASTYVSNQAAKAPNPQPTFTQPVTAPNGPNGR